MNPLGVALAWIIVQVTLFSTVGCLLYLVAQRWGPALGASSALMTLGLIGALSIAALLPGPRPWQPPGLAGDARRETASPQFQEGNGSSPASSAESNAASNAAPVAGSELSAAQGPSIWRDAWRGLLAEMRRVPAVDAASDRRWPAVLAALVAASAGLALVRIAAGLAAVRGYRRATRPIRERELQDALEIVCAQMSCARPIELRESSAIAAPAAIGWRAPAILLPEDWRGWSAEERQVVLAHEVAHIERGDYLSWLFAQACLALHFYHPLVHWLAGRLRLEQELAADRRGAEVVGGSRRYVTTLAALALRLDHRPASWAVRPFLPAQGAFLRRIEMLRDQRSPSAPASRRRFLTAKALLASTLAGFALLASGLRAPEGAHAAAAAPSSGPAALATSALANAAADQADFDLRYVPDDAAVVIGLRPSRLLGLPGMEPMVESLRSEVRIEEQLGFSIEMLDQIVICVRVGSTPDQQLAMLHARERVDWKKMINSAVPQATQAETLGIAYYKSGAVDRAPRSSGAPAPQSICAAELGGQTLLIGPEATLIQALADSLKPARSQSWSAAWNQVSQAATVAVVNVERMRGLFNQEIQQVGPGTPQAMFLGMFSPLMNQVNHVCLATDLADGLGLKLLANCTSAEAAQNVQATAQALLTLGANKLAAVKVAVAGEPDAAMKLLVMAAAEELAQQAKFSCDGSNVHLSSNSKLASTPLVAAFLMPAIAKARQAGRQSQSLNNLRQIALAMHNYASVHGHLPAASLLGPDGATLHSWRVELLPFLDQESLYREYRLNEPWDSAANQRVLARMPAVYRAPGAAPAQTTTPYLAPVGKETIFSSSQGVKLAEVTDGLSLTALILETARDVPWTRPEDLSVDLAKTQTELLAELAPALPGLLDAEGREIACVMADGSAHLLRRLSIGSLRSLLTRSGQDADFQFPANELPPMLKPVRP